MSVPTTTRPDMAAAARFLADTARVLDRRRFEALFEGGGHAGVRDAVRAYRNRDGGFGHALEPDARAAGSQPLAVEFALRTLHEADAWDDEVADGACAWLEGNAPVEGGAVFVAPGVEDGPHAPWWVPEPGLPASVITTGLIAATLHARGVVHPWLERSTELMWRRIEAHALPAEPYGMRAVLRFLDAVPDRPRAEAAFGRVAAVIRDGGLVAFDPEAPGEVHGPLDFAPEPGTLSRGLFDAETVEEHLGHLARAQLADGGWTFDWAAWHPAAEREWRGSCTVDALRVLRLHGRV